MLPTHSHDHDHGSSTQWRIDKFLYAWCGVNGEIVRLNLARLRLRVKMLRPWQMALLFLSVIVIIVVGFLFVMHLFAAPAYVWPVPSFHVEAYYHKCDPKYKENLDAITVATQLSANRLDRLATMALAWNGPLSAAVYVRTEKDVSAIQKFFGKDGHCETCDNVDLHIVHTDGGLYPINSLRNIARNLINTSRILLLDVDFVPSSGLSSYVGPKRGSMNVMSLPAFELLDGSKVSPATKKDLIDYISKGWAQPVNNQSWPIGHRATDFSQWYNAQKPYEAVYHYPFEPYYIGWKDDLPEYDERFRGYGEDKAQQCHHVFRMGYRFLVHHEHFAVHMPHDFDTGGWESEVKQMVRMNPLNTFFREMEEKYGPVPAHYTREPED